MHIRSKWGAEGSTPAKKNSKYRNVLEYICQHRLEKVHIKDVQGVSPVKVAGNKNPREHRASPPAKEVKYINTLHQKNDGASLITFLSCIHLLNDTKNAFLAFFLLFHHKFKLFSVGGVYSHSKWSRFGICTSFSCWNHMPVQEVAFSHFHEIWDTLMFSSYNERLFILQISHHAQQL